MSATIFIPSPLRKVTGGQSKIEVPASTLQGALDRANEIYPGFSARVLDGEGEIKRFINVFVNGVDVRKLQGRATQIKDGDEVSVIPAMAGGDGRDAASPALVEVDWLIEHLNDRELRLLDARVADPRLPMGYKMGHIVNAIPLDLNQDVYERVGYGMPRLKSPDALAQVLGSRGVSNDSTIVLYDEDTGPLAGFLYWLLKYLGHEDVRVLNGGWHAWQQAQGLTSRSVPPFPPTTYTPRIDQTQRASAEWIQESASRGDVFLLDVRSGAEYYMGHIPGAANLSFDEAIDYPSRKLKDAAALKRQLEAVGAQPDKEIVTYCGSGSRSAHTYLVLKALGYPRVRNYDGSMMDWAQVRRLPLD